MYLECRLFLSYHTMPRNNTSRMNLTHNNTLSHTASVGLGEDYNASTVRMNLTHNNNTLSHTASVGLGEDYNASTLIWVDNIIISLLFYCM